jgi:hypothetical protein
MAGRDLSSELFGPALDEEKQKTAARDLSAELFGAPAKEKEYGASQFAGDVSKKVSGALVGGVGSMPEGLEQGARGTLRNALTGENTLESIFGLIAPETKAKYDLDKMRVQEKVTGRSIEDQQKERAFIEQAIGAIPHIPGLRGLSDYAYGIQKNIEDSISEVGKERIRGATPEGNIFKGEFSFGKDPTLSGYALQVAGVFGSMAPTLAVSMLTKDPSKAVTRGTTVGGGMAAGEGAHEAREKLGKLSTKELYDVSPYYKGLVDNGVAPERAKELTISKASESAAMLQGMVGALGSNVTSKLMSGAFDHLIAKAGSSRLARGVTTGGVSGLEEGLQELGEGVASNLGVKQVLPSQELGEDSAANLALGFLGGAGSGGAKGVLTPAEKKQELQKGSVLDTIKEEQDVTEPINTGVGTSPAVDQQAGGEPAAQGAGQQNQPGGVVSPDATVAQPNDRKAAQSTSLENFHSQYNDLRDEALALMSKTRPTEADGRQLQLVQKDLNAVIDENVGLIGRQNAEQLRNPMFDGNKIIGAIAAQDVAGQAKAMQGDLFGSFGGANRSVQSAMALAGQDPAGALQQLENRKQRALAQYEENKNNPVFAMEFGSQLGMTKGEAARNPEAVAKYILDQTLANVEQAADQIKRTARPMQGDLFGEENKPQDEFAQQRIENAKTKRAEQKEFGAPIEGEETTEAAPAPVNQKEETVVAPDVSTEHVAQTEEGAVVKDFFDNIQSASETEESKKRHGESKNTAAGAMLSYDIVAPGEKSSPGAKKMLDYLAKRVGGMTKLRDLLVALREASPAAQSRLFERNNLPDLTSRRGMDEFRDQVQQYVDSIGGSEQGVRMPTKDVPSPFYGRTIPYTETITSTGVATQTRGPSAEGKPRRPVQGTTETEYVLVDRKVRNAVLILKQALGSGKKLSPQQSAAVTYLNSTNRSTFGQALADLAFDLAYGEIDPKEHGANSTFFGEGGKYAKAFQEWVVANLDQGTVDTLNEMVEEHKRNHAENVKFEKAITEYHDRLDAYSEQKRKDFEKRTKTKVPRAPKKVRITDIQEEEQERKVNVKNLPKIQMITEIHPMLKRLLEEGKVQEALDILANAKGNPYYAVLAQRLLDTGMTAESRLVDVDAIESLNNDPAIKESLDKRLEVLRDIVATMFPTEQQAALIAGLRSSKLRELVNAVNTIRNSIDGVNASEGQQQAVENTYELLNEEYAWLGKYDPSTDQIVLRSGAGRLTNHMFLHEALHAAASHLIDNADKLTGIQRQGYERLVELYEYSKKTLAAEEFNNEFYDLHEFVSYGLTDPIFQAHLRTLGYKAAPYSLWNQFTEAIRKLFNAKPGRESNVMVETMLATDAMLMGTMSLQGLNEAGGTFAGPAKPMSGTRKTPPPKRQQFRKGMANQKGFLRRILNAPVWSTALQREIRSANASARPYYLAGLNLRQINDLVAGRISQLSNFIHLTEDFNARRDNIIQESSKIAERWNKMQNKNPEMSQKLGEAMHMATMLEIDADPLRTLKEEIQGHPELKAAWNSLDLEAKQIYREVRDFFNRRYAEYKVQMEKRLAAMEADGISKETIDKIRKEYEQAKIKGPYFPLMRFGRFWYEIGPTGNREYYMFESQAARDAHIEERIAKDPQLADTIGNSIGNTYKSQMDYHSQQSEFLKDVFEGINKMNVTGLNPAEADAKKQALKDSFYQSYLQYQPDRSIRKRFIHRNNKAGYSEDALRSFSSSSYNVAYQLARFEYSPAMFSQLEGARMQIRDRFDPSVGYDPVAAREKDELNDYLAEAKLKLTEILNPEDSGAVPSIVSNIGFIYYLSSVASAVSNVVGGTINTIPILVGQQVRLNPGMSYTAATGKAIYQFSKAAAQIVSSGVITGVNKGAEVLGAEAPIKVTQMSAVDQAAHNKFVADGLIDITAAYDQSGLAAAPTTEYNGYMHKIMKVVAAPFHLAERLNREVSAMSAFRASMEKSLGKDGAKNLDVNNMTPDQQKAFDKAVRDAKDMTYRSQFDYSSTTKPRIFQNPYARMLLTFKQFPQNQIFLLASSFNDSIKKPSEEQMADMTDAEKKKFLEEHDIIAREARSRFVGIMGMSGIMAGGTGLFGFSTVAAIINAVFNFGRGDDEEEPPFDFELAFVDWATKTFGTGIGTAVTRGIPEAVTGLNIGSRVGLNNLVFRDNRKSEDWSGWIQSSMVDALGPIFGLPVLAARAADLWNQGHGDRALETVLPALARAPLVAYRYGQEGARTLQGSPLVEGDLTPFELFGQAIGFAPHRVSETQYYNATVKGQEQEIVKERYNLMNMYALTAMSDDLDGNDKVLDKIDKFNDKYPSKEIPMRALRKSLKSHVDKENKTEHGLYLDPRLVDLLSRRDYLNQQ